MAVFRSLKSDRLFSRELAFIVLTAAPKEYSKGKSLQ
jgi:hypothetical protein